MIPIAKPMLGDEEIQTASEIMKSGMLVQGEQVKKFEEEFAVYIGVKHAIAVSSGTSAIDIILKSLKIKNGDEVLVPDFTFISSATMISYQGAKAVLQMYGRTRST